MKLNGQKVVIFGGTSGIGHGVAAAALAEGADVTIVGRDADRLASAARNLGTGVKTARVDATNQAKLEEFYSARAPIDHIVATVHSTESLGGAMRAIVDMDLDAAEALMKSKYWTQFVILKLGAPHLAERGSITLTSGVASRGFVAKHGLLGPNNAAIESLAKYAARELGPKRVNCVSPGLTNTPTFDGLPPDAKLGLFKSFADGLPVGFVADPGDVAGAYIFAMTSGYVSGSVIDIDGGFMFGLLQRDNH